MATDRQTPCLYYVCAGLCTKGRKADHAHYCQHCNKYKPRARVRYKNQKKEKLEKIRKRQCQMTYEKTEQKKKAQMNLENCRSFRLWQLTATLDGTKKNCCRLITDGEELKNSLNFPSFTAVQQFFFVPSRAGRFAVAGIITSGSESKNSQRLRRVAGSESSVDQGR